MWDYVGEAALLTSAGLSGFKVRKRVKFLLASCLSIKITSTMSQQRQLRLLSKHEPFLIKQTPEISLTTPAPREFLKWEFTMRT